MKIKKSPPKKLAAPIPPIKNLIQKFSDCREEEIPEIVESVKEWSYPRGDLFHWIGVLNRFDTILENICQNYKLKKLQTTDFSNTTRSVLLAILRFSRLLLENCTNRNLYSSYEHLNDLLYTNDLEVLEALLRLILRPAQRLSNQRALRTNFNISQERILALAHSWGTKEHDIEMVHLASDDVIIPDELTSLNYQFYRHLTPSEAVVESSSTTTTATAATNLTNSTTNTQKNKRKDTVTTSTNIGGSNSTSKTSSEGVTLISVNDLRQYPGTDMDILNSLVQEYEIPEEFHYALLNRIRIATNITSKESRRRFLIIRILAIAIMAHVVQEHIAQSKIFLYEPDIVSNLSELVHPNRKVPFDVQTVAFYALDGISHYRSKLQEVLTAINASANHGILLYVLRKIIADLDSEHPIHPQDCCDSVFALITHIISTQIGGNMVISAGIIPTLLQLLHNKKPRQLKNVTKAVGLLDSLVYSFNQPSFNSFCNSNGVRVLVQRIKDEVDFGFQLVKDTQGDHMEDITTTSDNNTSFIGSTSKNNEPPNIQPTNTETEIVVLPYERSSLIKSMFKFVYHMMQSSGNAEGLRNLIDTTLPESLKKVFEQPSVFGSSIYAHAINLIATFIHNEPTSLPIMQESKLPQTFLKSIINDIPASVDVIQSLPNAFGAVCLNSQGMDIFNETNPINKFFSIFTSTEHLRALQDGDVASVLGTSIDELMRHHPSLKPVIMNAIMNTLKHIDELGQSDQYVMANDDTCSLHVGTSDDDDSPTIVGSENRVVDSLASQDATMTDGVESQKSEEKKENIVVSFIEIMARFLEGLFQNQSHCKEFLKAEEGLSILLKYYSLPTVPYDFASSQASYSLSHLMRVVTDVEPKRSVASIIKILSDTLQDASPFLNYEGKGGLFIDYIDLKVNDTAKIEAANKTFRTLITLHGYVGLLSDVYCSTVFSHGKSVSSSLIEAFVGNDNEILSSLGKLHRTCIWENVVLKSTIPKSWYNLQPKSKKSSFLSPSATSIFDDIDNNRDSTTTNVTTTDLTNEPPVDHNNRQVKNSKFLKFLITQIPNCLTPLFQGLAKMLFTRKSPDSNQRRQASKVSDCIASVFHDHLTWKRYEMDSEIDSANKYNYLTAMLGLLSLLFSDERNQISLQTMLVVSFEKIGGLDRVIYLLQNFWEEASALEDHPAVESDDKLKEKLGKIHECIKIVLNFFQFVASAKALHESSQTAIMTAKEKDPRFDKFDPYSFLVKIRSKILPAINSLWQSSYLLKAPPNIVKLVIQNLVQILRAEGEVNQRPEGSGSGSSSLSSATPLIFAHRNTIPDEDRVQQLLDMGFPRAAAETALSRCNNHVQTATEFLVTHPQTIAAALESSQQQENESSTRGSDAATTGATATTTTTSSSDANDDSIENTEVGTGMTTATSTSSNLDIFGSLGDEEDDDEDETSDIDEEIAEHHSILSQSLSLPTQSANLTIETSSSSNDVTVVPMETESTSSDTAATTKKTDKGKGKETSTIDQFKQLRDELKSNGKFRAIELLDQVEDAIFEVKDLFVLFCKDDPDKTIAFITDSIQSALRQQLNDNNDDDESSKKKTVVLSSRLRLLALLMNETSIQSNVSIVIFDNLVTELFNRISDVSLSKTKPELPKWLTPALLIVESLISLSDEPKFVSPLKTTKSPEDPTIYEDTGINIMIPNEIERLNLLGYCLGLIRRKDDLDKDLINALLRIFVRLTRQHNVALEFMRKDGLAYLFEIFKKRAHDFRGQQIFLVMLMRHVIEDESVIENIMEREIKNWFTNPRLRTVDINAYLKNTPQYALRNHDIFVKVTKKICKLTRFDTTGRNQQITLIRQGGTEELTTTANNNTSSSSTTATNQDATTNNTTAPTATNITLTNEEVMADAQTSTSVPTQSSSKKPIYDLDETESLIQFIAQELLSIGSSTPTSSSTELKTDETNNDNNNNDGSSTVDNNNNSNNANDDSNSNQPTFKPEEHQDYLTRCFLLQCLTELLSSYPSCKMEVINLSRRRNSLNVCGNNNNNNNNNNNTKSRTSLLNHLLNDLLPYGCITPSTDIEMRKRYGQSKWTTYTLVALCSNINNNNSETDNNNKKSLLQQQHDIIQVRKFVLDAIIRSFKSAIASTDPIEAKYGRLLALAELCHALLAARTGSSGANKPSEDSPASIAKIMLDKNFVNILTDALAEIDLNYPSARILINALLKPFEFLTKVAIKLGRSSDSTDSSNKEEEESISSISTPPSIEEMHPETENTPDLYATSVLGTLEGRVESDDMDDDDIDTSDEEEAFEEDFEEESGSDISDISDVDEGDDEDNDNEMDLEIVVRQPIRGHTAILENEVNDQESEDDDDEQSSVNHHLENEDDTDEEHHNSHHHHDDDDDDGDDDQEMWDVHDQVIIERGGDIREEAIINDDDDGHIHRHHHRDRFGGDDDSGDRDLMIVDDDEEDDEEDEEEDEEDDADDVEENDVSLDHPGALVDSFEEERLNFTNWGFNQPTALFMNDDEFSIPNRAGRALFSFGNRRHRHMAGRRTILEVPSDSFNYVFEDSDGYAFNIGGNDEVDIPGLNRSRPITSSNDDMITHPLLVNRAPSTPSVAGIELSRGRSIRNGPLGDWTHSIEELIGGGAVQLLEQLLTRGRELNRPTYRLELNPGSSGLVSGIDVDRVFQRISSNAQDNQSNPPPSDPISAVQEFMPLQTGNRWYEEARMMYGGMVTDKATKLANRILNELIPQAIEEDRKMKEKLEKDEKIRLEEIRKEEERRRRESKEAEERERIEAEAAAAAAAVAAATATVSSASATASASANNQSEEEEEEISQDTVMEEDTTSVQEGGESLAQVANESQQEEEINQDTMMEEYEPVATTSIQEGGESSTQGANESQQEEQQQQQQQPARTTVMINGQPVDITDTGIDPTFLEALPEDLREEVLNQHLPQRRTNTTVTGTGEISPEFLAALPEDLREEVLQQEEAMGQERRDRQRTTEPAAVEMDTASFFASLEPNLRQTVLLEQDDMVLASLPPAIAAEANALRERASRRYTNAVRSRTLANTVPQIQPPKKPTIQRDAIKLVDTQGLSTLVRLLFLPQPLNNKNILHKLLLNLCENSKSRGELISMLLSVLHDGSGDVTAVDKSFAQMSLRNKGTAKGALKRQSGLPNPSLSQITQAAGENVPNLIAQRCLEALTFIVSYNEASVTYFLSEHENGIGLKRTNSRKGKEKQKSIVSKYPVVILLSLLDRQVFIKNTSLMEQLMTLLSFVLRPLSSIAKSNQSNTTTTTSSNITSNSHNNENQTTTSENNSNDNNNNENDSSITQQSSPPPPPPPSSSSLQQQNNNENNSSNQNIENLENDKSTATASSSKQPETEQLKPPIIPEFCLRSVVNVMTVGECTGNTFKCTLTVIQYLSTLKGAREIITSELVDRSQSLGNEILCDLDELAQILRDADTGVDVQGVTLAKFSPSSSKQAKLLRVLKTIDYMYSSGQQQQQQTNAQTNTQVVVAPTIDPEEADSIQPRALEGNLRTTKLTSDEEKVMKIYESLSFTDLWNKLGKCLLTIHEKQDMIHVATVLLPLIESLMVVCKYVGMTPQSGQRSKASENMENLFFSFTEEHRKILNIMVRNNPSLMSGSFSLLVKNPKILEFDNKRNYFNQQLHKRTSGREHYGTLQLNVRRQYVFEDSFQNLQRRTGDEIKYGKLSVRFYEEEGVDAGGVTREWFQVLARQMFNENYALFKTSAADRLTYQPNRASGANPEHLLFFKFVGRVIGKAIYDGRLLDAYFTRSFYKHILGKPVDYRDVEAIDLGYYNSLVWMLNNDITNVVDLTFSIEVDDFGQKKIIDLKPNGRNIPVTEENKREYVKLVTEQRLTLAIKDQIESFLSGFHEIIPADLIKIFNEQELELLISGLPDIDIDDWKNNTEYQNYTASSPQIQWFWRVVRSFNQEERAKLLQFVTGTSKVPLEGFSALQGVHGVQKFQIHKDFSRTNRLPSAHTCFNQLDIPEYESYEQLRKNLLLAISEGTTGFGFQ